MKERLREVLADQKADCDEDALNLIIRSANGGMRDALGILEQLMAGSGSSITAEAAKKQLGTLDTDAILNTLASVIRLDTTSALSSMDNLLFSGKSPSLITETSLRVLTDMVTMKSTGDRQSIMHSRDYIETVWNLGHEISFNRLYWLCEQFCDLRTVIRQSTDPILDLRLALIRLSHQDIVSSDPIKLAEEVSMLKKEIEQLKGMIQKHPHTAVQEDDCTAIEPETLEEPAAEAGF